MERVDIWDGWRGLAILFVLVGHFYNIDIIWEDKLGVDIFFVLSGMLMSKILFEQRIGLKKFYIRRFSRIYPVFLAYVVCIYALAYLAKFEFSITEVLSTLVFLRTYLPVEPHIFETKIAVGHLWSLNVEEHAYVIMSVATLFVLSTFRAGLLLGLLGTLAILISFSYGADPNTQGKFFYIRTESAISFVFLSAGYSLLRNRYQFTLPWWIPCTTFFLAVSCYLNLVPRWTTYSVTPILLAITVNHLQDLPSIVKAALNCSALRTLGLYSYSIYLWQQPFYRYHDLLPGGKLTGLVLALVVGYLSFKLFENPVRQAINRRWAP